MMQSEQIGGSKLAEGRFAGCGSAPDRGHSRAQRGGSIAGVIAEIRAVDPRIRGDRRRRRSKDGPRGLPRLPGSCRQASVQLGIGGAVQTGLQ